MERGGAKEGDGGGDMASIVTTIKNLRFGPRMRIIFVTYYIYYNFIISYYFKPIILMIGKIYSKLEFNTTK